LKLRNGHSGQRNIILEISLLAIGLAARPGVLTLASTARSTPFVSLPIPLLLLASQSALLSGPKAAVAFELFVGVLVSAFSQRLLRYQKPTSAIVKPSVAATTLSAITSQAALKAAGGLTTGTKLRISNLDLNVSSQAKKTSAHNQSSTFYIVI